MPEEISVIATQRGLQRRKGNHSQIERDWGRNYGQKAYAKTKCNYAPPTHTLRTLSQSDHYTADPVEIHNLFMKSRGMV